jgi:protease II
MNGDNPTILYGYGGFNISLVPGFSVAMSVWIKNGGIYAVPNIRGGGEYGKTWHNKGTGLNKKNVFKDFISAAEYLFEKKYTSSKHLALKGGSNGGLLFWRLVYLICSDIIFLLQERAGPMIMALRMIQKKCLSICSVILPFII